MGLTHMHVEQAMMNDQPATCVLALSFHTLLAPLTAAYKCMPLFMHGHIEHACRPTAHLSLPKTSLSRNGHLWPAPVTESWGHKVTVSILYRISSWGFQI